MRVTGPAPAVRRADDPGQQDQGLAVDVVAGNAYVTGATSSTEATFPVSVGPDLTYNGGVWDSSR